MHVSVYNSCPDYTSYRAARVKSLFNAERGNEFRLEAELPVEGAPWGIGLIVGPSGSGKTSIGRNIFGGGAIHDLYAGWPADAPIVDGIAPAAGEFNAVTGALAAVGLGDVPAWLRPFHALSNGQQFRAGLARLICGAETQIVVDEFTSVIDRQIAKIGAQAFAKSWARTGRQVVLLSCHYDIIEWVQPDWVFDTGTGEFLKKASSESDRPLSWKFGRSTPLTGSILKHITI